MRVVITEKPDVANNIAKVIGATVRKPEWWEGNGWKVTWMYGHLLEISVPESKVRWDANHLPIIPASWELEPTDIPTRPGQRPRLEVIRELFQQCDYIVVATDAGREGELIFRNLYDWLGIRKPFKRLWISSLTEQDIREGFEYLHNGHEFDNLADAARQRARADWLVGINATRALTVAAGAGESVKGKRLVLSLGRVQTPTLCIICRRYIENQRFKPEPFWYLEGESEVNGQAFKWRSVERYGTREACEAAKEDVQRKGTIVVEEVEKKRVTEQPPLLYDTNTLQKEANAKYGMTLSESLEIAQSLYEKKFITYPRTGSRYISESVYEKMPDIIKTLAADERYAAIAGGILSGGRSLNRRSVNDVKLTDHHAIIVTGNKPEGLTENEDRIYDLVATRVLEAVSDVCIADRTSVILAGGEVNAVKFFASGRKEVSLGWRAVRRSREVTVDVAEDIDAAESVELNLAPLPEMQEGDRIGYDRFVIIEDKTKPKPLLTDATLLTEMMNAGRKSDEKEVTEALRDIGIGRESTRSEILETLIKRGYVVRNKRHLLPTELGLEVYVAIKDKGVANVAMTARWEMALDDIADGQKEAVEFENSIKDYTRRLTSEILGGGGLERLRGKIKQEVEKTMIKCPRCGKEMRLSDKAVWCTNKECDFHIFRGPVAGKTLSDETYRKLINNGETGVLTGFVSNKTGNKFEARLRLDASDTIANVGRLLFEFPEKKNK